MAENIICSNCVMDTTDSMISFDESGVCDHCRTYHEHIEPKWDTGPSGLAEMRLMVEDIKTRGKGHDFDCILGMSGGVDSSFLLHLAKEELGLRPLVFHVDAGWNSEVAVNNIQSLVEGLGLDLYTEVIDWEEMRDLQLAYFRSGVPHIDLPQDTAFFGTMYKFAEEYGVKDILTGANYSTECIRNPTEWIYYGDTVQLQDIHSRFGERPLKSYPIVHILKHKLWFPYAKGIKVRKPLNYMPYVKKDAVKLLSDRYGWKPYPQKHFESRFTRFYEGYWLPTRFGYDTRKVQFSSLILTGQMTRADALEELKQLPLTDQEVQNEKEYIAAKLRISVDELEGCLTMPLKTHKDYKSQRRLFAVGAAVMKTLGLERGGKR